MAKYIGGGRATGKTTECLRVFNATLDAVLVTFSEAEASRLRELVPKKSRGRVVSAVGCRAGLLGSAERFRLVVDNADLVLGALLGGEVYALSMTEGTDV